MNVTVAEPIIDYVHSQTAHQAQSNSLAAITMYLSKQIRFKESKNINSLTHSRISTLRFHVRQFQTVSCDAVWTKKRARKSNDNNKMSAFHVNLHGAHYFRRSNNNNKNDCIDIYVNIFSDWINYAIYSADEVDLKEEKKPVKKWRRSGWIVSGRVWANVQWIHTDTSF